MQCANTHSCIHVVAHMLSHCWSASLRFSMALFRYFKRERTTTWSSWPFSTICIINFDCSCNHVSLWHSSWLDRSTTNFLPRTNKIFDVHENFAPPSPPPRKNPLYGIWYEYIYNLLPLMHTTILVHHSVTMATNVTDYWNFLNFPYCYITASANSSSHI